MPISTHDSTVHKRSYKISYSPLDDKHSFEASLKLALKIIFLPFLMRQQSYAKLLMMLIIVKEVAEGEISDPHDFTPQQQDEQQPEARRARRWRLRGC